MSSERHPWLVNGFVAVYLTLGIILTLLGPLIFWSALVAILLLLICV